MTGLAIKPQTLVDQIHQVVRRRIIDQAMRPGERIVIDQLARELAVSQTPIREALRLLEFEGLIQVLPHRSAVVVRPSRKKFIDLLQVRMVLEAQAVKLVARRISDLDMKELEQILVDAADSIREKNMSLWSELDDRFHDYFAKQCGNEVLARMFDQLNNSFAVYRRFPMVSRFPDGNWEALAEHRQVYEYVVTGDGKSAAGVMVRHIRKSLRCGLQSFKAKA